MFSRSQSHVKSNTCSTSPTVRSHREGDTARRTFKPELQAELARLPDLEVGGAVGRVRHDDRARFGGAVELGVGGCDCRKLRSSDGLLFDVAATVLSSSTTRSLSGISGSGIGLTLAVSPGTVSGSMEANAIEAKKMASAPTRPASRDTR